MRSHNGQIVTPELNLEPRLQGNSTRLAERR